MAELLEYPKQVPQTAIYLFLDEVRGKHHPVPDLVNAGWNLVGYGLHLGLPQVQPVGATADEMSDEDALVYMLDNLQDPGTAAQAGPLAALALSIVLKLAWSYLQKKLPDLLPI
jgi:hypothetical protein